MPTEKEIKIIQQSAFYDLRLIIKSSDKEQYTKEELFDLLDTIVEAKAHE